MDGIRGSGNVWKAALAGIFLVVIAVGGIMGNSESGSTGSGSVGCQMSGGSSAIPADYFPWLQEAAAKYKLGPRGVSIVAAIHYVESDWDQSTLPGVAAGTQNYAGAEGPGQFLVESWATYGVDANGDGVKDVYSVPDSVFGTANMLHADGAPKDWRDAIWDYNNAWWYVEEVLEKASQLRGEFVCASDVTLAGAARTLERMKAAATWIESKELPYCWGGGHGAKPGPSTGTRVELQCPPGTVGLDCSGSVRWLLVLSGYPDPGGERSDILGAEYPAGEGRVVTIWSNFVHIWIEIDGRDWGTATSNPEGGPGWAVQSKVAFNPTHPPGL